MMERKVVTQLGVTVPNCLTYLLHNSIYVCTKIKLLLNIQRSEEFSLSKFRLKSNIHMYI